MSERIVTQTGRVFERKSRSEYFFIRDEERNQADIATCAALAFHKAIIGIAELSLVEDAGNSLRFAKAVQTYYPVYHLLACNMLLDPQQEIVCKYHPDEYEVDKDRLNSKSETPQQWNDGKSLERDLASILSHGNIKCYCERIRGRDVLSPYTQVLYEAFIKNAGDTKKPCIPGLFEKLDYIRDRALYRPTHVIYKDGGMAQTSYEIRSEIESLPTSDELYAVVLAFYEKACASADSINELFKIHSRFDSVRCSSDYASRLGYTWEAIEKMGGSKEQNCVPAFLCQMMELFDEADSLRFYQKYWKKIMI